MRRKGTPSRTNHTIVITNGEEVVLERCRELWKSCFGLQARITRQPGKGPGVVVASKTVVEFMANLGCGSRSSDKRIPTAVMRSPKAVVLAFLQGLALDAYTSSTGSFGKWAICVNSPLLLDDLQSALRHLGLLSGRNSKYNVIYGRSYDEVFLSGGEAQRFLSLVPFLEPSKQPSANRLLERPVDSRRNGSDVVPLVKGAELYAEIPKGRSGRSGAAITWRALVDKRTVWPSRWIVEQLAAANVRLPDDVKRVLDENLHFSLVR